jgi:hypothetical protein
MPCQARDCQCVRFEKSSGSNTSAAVVGITWPVPAALDDVALERKLFTPPFTSEPGRPQPDWPQIHAELRKPGVTLLLLWEEYRAGQPDEYLSYYRVAAFAGQGLMTAISSKA